MSDKSMQDAMSGVDRVCKELSIKRLDYAVIAAFLEQANFHDLDFKKLIRIMSDPDAIYQIGITYVYFIEHGRSIAITNSYKKRSKNVG